MLRFRVLLLSAATLTFIDISVAAYAQYYAPPPGYGRPPCAAVTRGPLRGAGRGAAGGALIGAISGNAGRGAAIGAGVGAIGGAPRGGGGRRLGYWYLRRAVGCFRPGSGPLGGG